MILICLFSCCLTGHARMPSVEYGMASYYSDEFHGKKTASGEIYDKWDYTCAHRTLPFGTKIKVTNLENKKSVIVRVNDRGPHKEGRIVDLSYIAARDIDMLTKGVVKVRIEVIK
ncbi:MAG: septal ring lytic transglycosylase RlpA family protein [candidate division WOR-3 bacterium]|nr:septal ring lytic transglycosylase RlpA family protein [candidate division WOR-3 bacterium]